MVSMPSLSDASSPACKGRPSQVLTFVRCLNSLLYSSFLLLLLLLCHVRFQARLWSRPTRRSPVRCDEAYFARLGAQTKPATRIPSHLALILDGQPDRGLLELFWTGLRARIFPRTYSSERDARVRRANQQQALVESVRAIVRPAALAGVHIVSVYDPSGDLSSIFAQVQHAAHAFLDHQGEEVVLPRSIFALAQDVIHAMQGDEETSLEPGGAAPSSYVVPRSLLYGVLAMVTAFVPALSSAPSAFHAGRVLLMWARMAQEKFSAAAAFQPEAGPLPQIKVQLSLASSPSQLDTCPPTAGADEKVIRLHIIGPQDGKKELAQVADHLVEEVSFRAREFADAVLEARAAVRQQLYAAGPPDPTQERPLAPDPHILRRGFEWRRAHRWARLNLTSTVSPTTVTRHLAAMGLPPPPDLLLIKGRSSLAGFPPWPLGLTEIFLAPTDEWASLPTTDLDAALRQYATAEQRFGR